MKNYVNNIKNNLLCVKCGDNRNYVLDFHHLDKSKKEFSISKLLTYSSKDKIDKEISKCICLCSNCHREFHYLEKKNNIFIDNYLKEL